MNVLPSACRTDVVTLLRFVNVPLNAIGGLAEALATPTTASAATVTPGSTLRSAGLVRLLSLPNIAGSPHEDSRVPPVPHGEHTPALPAHATLPASWRSKIASTPRPAAAVPDQSHPCNP